MDKTLEQLRYIAKNWRDLIRPRQLETSDHTRTHASFRCEPLERGFGTTLGQLLRGTLLSAIPGAAITRVAVIGEPLAELPEILLSLKQVAFSSDHDGSVTLRLDAVGPGSVTARDIRLVDGIRCWTPELEICTLETNRRLTLLLELTVGRGYVPADCNAGDLPPGTVALDALFSPIRKVTFAVTNARVGHQTDYDRLALDVSTTGAIDPVDAVSRAAQILRDQLGTFLNFDEVPEPAPVPVDEVAVARNENLWRTVEELELSVRASNCLRNLHITYIGELVQQTEAALMKSRGFGRKSLTEISGVLAEMKLHLGMDVDGWSGKPR